ncbi:imidazolonepropionase [Cytophagaceae bacterium DM2B3-1]|uniref:Imidazolonepropionase n=1 Tax=Xanthocytophaga flava TaxID=3048013 RepID=A0ABT7CSM4_9BACT|nr:imidazolonepropionase [Xanthocytophaga flavus]MDJ1496744.1 imidazolonepropionase [Xanthocytophaga flavus]
MLIVNIKQLVGIREETTLLRGKAMAELPYLDNAFLRIIDDKIVEYGEMKDLSEKGWNNEEQIDVAGQYVLPAWCDSHSHLVYAGSRETEFVDKIKGMSYETIAKNGGGILNSAQLLNNTSEEDLFHLAWQRLEEVKKLGTGAIEIKSGYGLTAEGELKMLRVIRRLQKESDVLIKSTFLGAHTYPASFKDNHQGYIRQIIEDMLPVIAEEQLADYIDVFCEQGFFSVQETEQILEAGIRFGLKPKLHANQLHVSGGVQIGVKYKAISVDHLESIGEAEIDCLKESNTIATLLPSAAFFLRMSYPPARQMLDANLPLAIATDYNPGSSPSGNMPFLVALSCIQLKMTPEEAINAATINGAFAMELQDSTGSISRGKKANLILTKPMPSLAYLPYSFGSTLIDKVMIQGQWV